MGISMNWKFEVDARDLLFDVTNKDISYEN